MVSMRILMQFMRNLCLTRSWKCASVVADVPATVPGIEVQQTCSTGGIAPFAVGLMTYPGSLFTHTYISRHFQAYPPSK